MIILSINVFFLRSEDCIPFSIDSQSYWYWRTWLTPALTKQECTNITLGRAGCLNPNSPENHMYWFNQSECDCKGGTFGQTWEWEAGVWRGGQARPAAWVAAKSQVPYVWRSSLSFDLLTSWVRSAVEINVCSFPFV